MAMDFDPNPLQRDILDSLSSLLGRRAGVDRARDLAEAGAYDHDLHRALVDDGYGDIYAADEDGPLTATLVVEAVAGELGAVSATSRLLVLPALGLEVPEGPIVLRREQDSGPFRFGAEARTELMVTASGLLVRELDSSAATSLPTAYGFPLANISDGTLVNELDETARDTALTWWRVGVAAEAVGLMRRAFEEARDYATIRTTFGRPIGSLQALQHRLADLSLKIEGARWMTYEAASLGGDTERAATAAAYTMSVVTAATRETHQILGAIGLTSEHDLHLWTLRLQAIRSDLGGVRHHYRALARARWSVGA